MSEHDAVKKSTHGPITTERLITDLKNIGVQPGRCLLVHASLSSMGWVCGGAPTVISALRQVLTPSGTLVMPAHSGHLSDPSYWENPPVPENWWPTIRDHMPAYHPATTLTRGMGTIAETFRTQKQVLRSAHPQGSFTAWGKEAKLVTDEHALNSEFGDQSPLGKVYALNGSILLLGVGYDKCTSLHLAEECAEFPSQKTRKADGAPIIMDGKRKWITIENLAYNSNDFVEIGRAYESEGSAYKKGTIGYAPSTLIPQRRLVDFAVGWMEKNRK